MVKRQRDGAGQSRLIRTVKFEAPGYIRDGHCQNPFYERAPIVQPPRRLSSPATRRSTERAESSNGDENQQGTVNGAVTTVVAAPRATGLVSITENHAPTKHSVITKQPHTCAFLVFDGMISRWDRIVFHLMACNDLQRRGIPDAIFGVEPKQRLATDSIEVRLVADPTHPAFGQRALFASKKIPFGQPICVYTGVVQSSATFPSNHCYTMSFGNSEGSLEIDAQAAGNWARFANDPRGTGRNVNVEAVNKQSPLGESYTVLLAKTIINPGDEILLDYGKAHPFQRQELYDDEFRAISSEGAAQAASSPTIRVSGRESGGEASARTDSISQGPRPLLKWFEVDGPATQRLTKSIEASLSGPERDLRARLFWSCDNCGEENRSREATGSGVMRRCGSCQYVQVDAPALHIGPVAEVPSETKGDGNGAALTLAGAGSSISCTWPIHMPLLTWHVFDSLIPESDVISSAVFVSQPKLSIGEVEMVQSPDIRSPSPSGRQEGGASARADQARSSYACFVTESVAKGRAFASAGGIVLPRDYCRQLQRDEPSRRWRIVDVALQVCQGTTSEGSALPEYSVILLNEAMHIRQAAPTAADTPGGGGRNVTLELRRHHLGFIYLAVVALRDLNAWDELVR